VIDGGVGGRAKTPIRFVIPKGRGGELGWAKEVTPRVVGALEEYFDMDYPFGKLDVAVVPRYWGTMEHPGIVAMGQPLTLIRPDQATRSRKQHYTNILAHELAHYWFGDLVTMTWWDDTWLNEALGQWMDLIITHQTQPAWRVRDGRVEMATAAMDADEKLSTRAIRQPVTTAEGIAASFDGEITYLKGSSVFRMFEAWVGPAKWRDLIREYMRAHAWGNASAEDLLGLARARLGAPVELGLRSFLDQPGVPLIKADVECATGKPARIKLRQSRAVPAGTTDPVAHTWQVPVCMRYGQLGDRGSKSACVQLAGSEGELVVESCPSWVITNADASGYYRSGVDLAVARGLLTPGSVLARAAQPTPAERMMLVADLGAAVERGELALDQVLGLVPLISADPDDLVATSAFGAATLHEAALDDELYAKAVRFAVRAFAPTARRLGWQRAAADSDERHALRVQALAAVAPHDPALGRQADQLADRWLAKRSGVEDDLVGPMLASVSYRGGMPRFEQLLTEARRARDRTEQARLLGSLGGFRDPAIATRALELVLGKELDLRETRGILFGVLARRETRDLGLRFLEQHLDELLARMRSDEASWMLGGLAGAFCDPQRRGAVATLVTARAEKIDGAQAQVARGLERSDQCIASAARQLPALRAFLAKY
jgi:aminopeptidase N